MSKYSHYYPLCLGFIIISLGVILWMQGVFVFSYIFFGFIVFGIGLLLYIINNSDKKDQQKLKNINRPIESSPNHSNLSVIEQVIFEYLTINYGKPFTSRTLLKRKAELLVVTETLTKSNLKESLEKLYQRGLIKHDFIKKEHYYYVIKQK